ncbi:NAD(P)/FAD-dependent oxidoreductase [Pseudooceanicola algae]|uniref:Gamma-glutamylputrescine oxidoreductase n=1 Tax=Pseudooceanicola algae TaxID=1537215 RepID=A0A418SFN2_9RHOB|nr:FAD-binding oxidoreductase [Pseudooceanicola algae]QPM91507.1 Gamma-glutamylputrescine oxidoreductase [Pseudooceanicola algae]
MRTPSATPLWQISAAEPETASPLAGASHADLAIVGAGFTGLSTALHGATAGLDCLVLEAERPGFGGSGRNVGLVNAGVWLPPRKVRATMGDGPGAQFIDYFGTAPERVFDLIEKHQIRCEPRRNGTIHAAHSPAGFRDLQARAADWHAIGAPVDLLDPDETAKLTGTRGFHGGLLDHRAGTINPEAYCRGLARAARAAGARIATGTEVTALRRDGDLWHLTTSQGNITARAVVLATNAYTGGLWPGLAQGFTPISFFQCATAPLGAEAAHVLPGGQGLWTTAPVMTSLRRDADGRIILGSMGRITRGTSLRWANRTLQRLYPELPPVGFETCWHGTIAMTPDHLPRIHRLAPDLYTPIGYNGRGITTGTIFGQAIAALLTGAGEDSLPLPLTAPTRDRARGLKAGVYRVGFAAHQFLKSI